MNILKPMAGVSAVMCLAVAPAGGAPLPEKIQRPARLFPLEQVRLQDPALLKMRAQTLDYLRALDSERLLYHFRITAGVPTDAEPLSRRPGDHEAPASPFRGHFTGHYLSASAMMVAGTGDAELKKKADALVAALVQCQRTNGYLAGWPEADFDKLEAGQRVGVLWYGLHKILAGLLDQYQYAGNAQALDAARRLGDWAAARTARLDHARMQKVLATEFGGMGEVLADLAAVTGEQKYLDAARRFDHDRVFQPAARGEDALTGLHANTQVPKFVSAARLYELTGDAFYQKAATFFWQQVARHRSYASGGNSVREGFKTPPDVLAGTLETRTQETCNTHNMLKLTEHLFTWAPDAERADYYERALLNHILGTPHPDTGMPLYYLGLKPGQWKCVFARNDSFWCCAGTGLENFAKLQRGFYFEGDGELWVNLFFASELDWRARGVTLRQETRFPDEPGTTLVVTTAQPTAFKLHRRIPWWAEGASITVNGRPVEGAFAPSSYATLDRTWANGDRVRLNLPMRLHLHPMPDDPRTVAILYGPVVLAGELGTADLPRDGIHIWNHHGDEHFNAHPYAAAADLALKGTTPKPEDWIEPVVGRPLTFQTRGVGRPDDVVLSPFFRLFDQRYNVYWRLIP